MVCTCDTNYAGWHNRKITVQTSWSIKGDPISKIANIKRARGMAQVTEHMPTSVRP
jgi:hypothetical protein